VSFAVPFNGPPSQKEQAVQAMFSSIARFYDLNNTCLSLGLHYFWKAAAVKEACLCPGERVLDLGAGTLDLSLLALREVKGDGVVALDLNEAMLREGQRKLSKRHVKGITLLLANAEQLPLPDKTFDVVLTGFCVRNLANMDRSLKEVHRVLKSRGRFVCLEFSSPQSRLLRKLYNFYSLYLLPKIGTFISGDKTAVYQYLPDSIRKFDRQEAFCARIKDAGFASVYFKNLSGGIVAIHVGQKSDCAAGF